MDTQFVLNNFLNFSEIGLTSLLKYYYNSTKVLWELLLMMVLPQSLSDMGTQDILIIIVMMPPEWSLEHHGGQSGYLRQYLSFQQNTCDMTGAWEMRCLLKTAYPLSMVVHI